jgi:hypothetical protein
MSGTTAPGARPRRGAPSPAACPAARGCQTQAGGGAPPFEEAEGTRLLLDRLAEYFAGESRLKKPMAEWTGPGRSFLLICGNVN